MKEQKQKMQQELAAKEEALAAKDQELSSLRAEIEARDESIANLKERAEAGKSNLRSEAVAAASEQREEGFYLAKDQVSHLFLNIDLSLLGMFKEITGTGLVGLNDPPRIVFDYEDAGNEEEGNVNNDNN